MLKNILLLQHQKPMLKTIGNIVIKTLKKQEIKIPKIENVTLDFTVTPHKKIVESFHRWLGVSKKYSNSIAPHLYPQWAIPELFKLGEDYSLPLHKVLNQGCRIKINGILPLNSNLVGKVQLLDIIELDGKYRINQKIWTGPKENPAAIEAEINAVILKNNKKSFSKAKRNIEHHFSPKTLLSRIYISENDAKNYGLISGDVNPIHMSKYLAKIFGLKTSLMHGFGLSSILFEEIEKHALIIKELEIKFLNPVYLNNYIKVYLEPDSVQSGQYSIKVCDDTESKLHIVGVLKIKNS